MITSEECGTIKSSLANDPKYAYDILQSMRKIERDNNPKLQWWQAELEKIKTVQDVVHWLTKHNGLLSTLQEEDQLKVHGYINDRLDNLKAKS